jgi:hypothetical protein
MPRKCVTVSEQRDRFLVDFQLTSHSLATLARSFSISPEIAHKKADRFLPKRGDTPKGASPTVVVFSWRRGICRHRFNNP